MILAVDGINVVDATHKRVISLMNNAALNGKVTLRVRRKADADGSYSICLCKHLRGGAGFQIMTFTNVNLGVGKVFRYGFYQC